MEEERTAFSGGKCSLASSEMLRETVRSLAAGDALLFALSDRFARGICLETLPHSPRTFGTMREVIRLRCPSCESTRILVVLGPNPRASCRDCGCRWVQEGSEQILIRRPGEISGRARHPSHRQTGSDA